MTIKELQSSLGDVYAHRESAIAVLYAIVKKSGDYKVDIEGAAQKGMSDLFLQHIKDTIIDSDTLSLLQYSSADERKNALYEYDLPELPQELSCFERIYHGCNGIPLLNLNDESIADIKALFIQIGTSDKQLILYKTMASVNIFKRDSFFLIKDSSRLKQIDNEFLRISSNFQMIYMDGSLIISELAPLEKAFDFNAILTAEARQGIEQIALLGILEDASVYEKQLGNVSIAKRLLRLAEKSPVIKSGIETPKIIKFCTLHHALQGKFSFTPENDKIILKTKKSQLLFLKLLMDDFLTSELTSFQYDSQAKDVVTVEEGIAT